MKTIAAFFEVNDDTNSEAFGKWLDTCTFSNQVTVDYDYKAAVVVPAGTPEVEVDSAASPSGSLSGIPAPATLMDGTGSSGEAGGITITHSGAVTEEASDLGNGADASTADQATSSQNTDGEQSGLDTNSVGGQTQIDASSETGTEAQTETANTAETQVGEDGSKALTETGSEAEKAPADEPAEEQKQQE